MEYNISYNNCAICIDVMVLILFLYRKNYAARSNRAYMLLVIDAIIAATFDNISTYTIQNAKDIPIELNYAINTIFYLSMNTILLWYCNYLLCIIYKTRPFTLLNKIFLVGCGIIDLVLIITNPFTKYVFYFDENFVYSSGSLKIVVYIVSLCLLVSCIYETIRNHESLDILQITGMFFVTVLNTAAVIYQIFYPNILITSFTVSMALIIIYLSIQDIDNYVDRLTRTFTQQAFEDTLSSFVNTKKPFSLITVKLEEFRKVNEMAGVAAGNRVLMLTSQRLKDIAGKENLFYNSGTRFSILVHDKGMDEEDIINRIRLELRKAYEIGDMEIHLRPLMVVVRYPDHGESVTDLEEAVSYCLRQMEKSKVSDLIYADSLTMEQVRRNIALDKIMQNALYNGEFQVYYQPIIDVNTKKYHSAEALLRLINSEYGFISPDEFIPRAEETGFIIDVGEFVFEEVCKAIERNEFGRLGLDYIEINLSAAQCVQKDLKEKFFNIMKKYHIRPEMINLEITETATISSSKQLQDFMNNMLHDGIRFSLDDYGSGLANINYLLAYPFNIVKLDKYLVWTAFAQSRAKTALMHSISMLKDLNYEIIAEGIETEEQAAELKNMGCDKFQGFLYSKPIPKDDFVRFIKENR